MPRIEARRQGARLLPLVEIVVEVEGEPHVMQALVDSGSDRTLVPKVLLPSRSRPKAKAFRGAGLGGRFEGVGLDAEARWEGTVFADRVVLIENSPLPVAILGRNDFFRRFRVAFDWTAARPFIDIEPA